MNEMMHTWNGFSPYEAYKVSEMTSRRPNGGAVTGIVLGSVGVALGVGAWIFGPVLGNQKANAVRDIANVQFTANQQQLALLTNLLSTERAERVAQGTTISQSITDSISGSQSSTLTAQQQSELSSFQNLQNTLLTDAVTGRSSLNPTPITIYSAPSPCTCPSCGCGN